MMWIQYGIVAEIAGRWRFHRMKGERFVLSDYLLLLSWWPKPMETVDEALGVVSFHHRKGYLYSIDFFRLVDLETGEIIHEGGIPHPLPIDKIPADRYAAS